MRNDDEVPDCSTFMIGLKSSSRKESIRSTGIGVLVVPMNRMLLTETPNSLSVHFSCVRTAAQFRPEYSSKVGVDDSLISSKSDFGDFLQCDYVNR